MNLEEHAVAATPQPVATDTPAEAPAAAPTAAPSRRRRPEPLRTAPLRHAATLLRDAAPAAAAAAPAAGAGAAAGEGPVALGVRLGYQVIEEQILLGQKLAQRLGRKAARAVGVGGGAGAGQAAEAQAAGGGEPAARSDAATATGEAGELLDRVVHLYKDMGALCVDAVEALARNPVLRAGVARLTPTPTSGVAGGANSSHRYALDIRCSRRTQVTLDLRGHSAGGLPRVHALHAADPTLPPLTDVRFTIDPAQPEPVLQLVIADDQPAATYTGVVVDGSSNEPRGTLSIRVLP